MGIRHLRSAKSGRSATEARWLPRYQMSVVRVKEGSKFAGRPRARPLISARRDAHRSEPHLAQHKARRRLRVSSRMRFRMRAWSAKLTHVIRSVAKPQGSSFMKLSSAVRSLLVALTAFAGIGLSTAAHADGGTITLT